MGAETADNSNVNMTTTSKGASGSHRIHLKVVDKLLKEKFKHMKAKDDADDMSRRKL